MSIIGFLVKRNRIVGVRVEKDGSIYDKAINNDISQLDLLSSEYIEGISVGDNSFITLDELFSGRHIDTLSTDLVYRGLKKPITYKNVTLDFSRDIELNMYDWLYNYPDKALYISGARQTGKTYVINKFLNRVWGSSDQVYRLNLMDKSVELALHDFYKSKQNISGSSTLERFARFYFDDFDINKADVLFVDEIQEDSGLYNTLREFAREGKCRLIVSGSYLNIVSQIKLGNNEFKVQAGGTYSIELSSLSFLEFLRANGVVNIQVLLKNSDYYTDEDNTLFDKVQRLYYIYLKIGGYPEVVKEYIKTGSVESAKAVLVQLIYNYFQESKPYLAKCNPMVEFEEAFKSLLAVLTDTSKRFKISDIPSEVSKSIRRSKGSINTNDIVFTLDWLVSGGFLGKMRRYCDLSDLNNYATGQRYYFKDLGVVNFIADLLDLPDSVLNGYLAENFAYLQLYDSIRFSSDSSLESTIGYYIKSDNSLELDFIYKDINKGKSFVVVEVKYKNAGAKSLRKVREGKYFKYAVKAVNAQTDTDTGSIPIFLLRYFYILNTF